MQQKIYPCLWFDGQAEQAAGFYTALFPASRVSRTARVTESVAKASGQQAGSVLTVDFELDGHRVLALNGGPHFKFTPALSFFVCRNDEQEIDRLWASLSSGGELRMPLDRYPWAEKYGWTADRFGVEWQLMLSPGKQKIAPAFLFVREQFGKGQEAIDFYRSVFRNSEIESIARDEATKSVQHCAFSLEGTDFALMEGPGEHNFTFTPAFSLVVDCQDQAEIDAYWSKLSDGGTTEQCGWLKDKYGVSWQVVPSSLGSLISQPGKADKVMAALMGMHKLDMGILEAAGNDATVSS